MSRLASITGVARFLGQRVKPRLCCSFCGRNADQVGRLVAGPSVYICDIRAVTPVFAGYVHREVRRGSGTARRPPAGAPAEQDRLSHA